MSRRFVLVVETFILIYLINANCNHVWWLIKLYTLLYADDTILLSESPEDLQNMLTGLHKYCRFWHLTVNISITQVVVFSKGKIRNPPSLFFGDEPMLLQTNYTYLGIVFNYNGNFTQAMSKQVSQAKRAMFSLISKARKLQLPLDLQCHLFDTCIVPILLYGCEVWGFSNLSEIEKVHNQFCKYILKLNVATANCMARGELGRPRLECLVKQRMVNFWTRMVTGKASKVSRS